MIPCVHLKLKFQGSSGLQNMRRTVLQAYREDICMVAQCSEDTNVYQWRRVWQRAWMSSLKWSW